MSNSARGTHREALLQAARALIRQRGYGNITARDLVAASGTNLASIGYHFGSKEALLNEATGQALEEWAETISQATRAETSAGAHERMAAAWRALLGDFDRVRPYFLAFIEAVVRSARSPELAQQLAAHYDKQRDRVAAMLEEAAGGALGEESARRIATFLIAMSDGLMLQSLVDPSRAAEIVDLASATGTMFGQSS